MAYMKYEELVEFVNKEESGIAKGYDLQFLRDKFRLDKVKQTIENDLKIFGEIEKSLLSQTTPKEGDWVKYDDVVSRVSRIHPGGSIQLSENIGVNVWHDTTQASGCVWDSNIDISRELLHIKNLVPTNEVKEGKCWIFSNLEAGAGRGVYHKINFRVWELKGGVA